MRIADRPRYTWRGLLLDSCRHFQDIAAIERLLDLMSLHKLNRLHWHLTEDQGWRLETRSKPRLTEVAAWRTDGATAASTRRTRRGTSWRTRPRAVQTEWGVFADIYCAGNDAVFAFLEDVLTEVLDIFPSSFIHLGGDECPPDRWLDCPRCQQRMAGGLADGAVVQSWRGFEGAKEALAAGHDTIVSPISHVYLDQDIARVNLETVLSFEPEVAAGRAGRILGGEMCLWTERIPQALIDERLFPRACAGSEVLWRQAPAGGAERRDLTEFLARLEEHGRRLRAMGVGIGPW